MTVSACQDGVSYGQALDPVFEHKEREASSWSLLRMLHCKKAQSEAEIWVGTSHREAGASNDFTNRFSKVWRNLKQILWSELLEGIFPGFKIASQILSSTQRLFPPTGISLMVGCTAWYLRFFIFSMPSNISFEGLQWISWLLFLSFLVEISQTRTEIGSILHSSNKSFTFS